MASLRHLSGRITQLYQGVKQRVYQRRYGIAALMVAGVIAIALSIWPLYGYIDPTNDQQRNEFVRTIVQTLGGLALVISLFFSYRTLLENQKANRERERLTQEANETTNKALLENQLANRERERLTQEANYTDRFAKAVEQLASDQLTIRLGAIFSLERLARDSARDHQTIMELLTAYVRENAPVVKQDYADLPRWQPRQPETNLPADIQAIMTVLGRRDPKAIARETQPLDLRGVKLRAVNLPGARLGGANLDGADLYRACLTDADLTGAHLNSVNLTGADLTGARLIGARLFGACLARAFLVEADLTNALLNSAELGRARLTDADLTGARQ
jgi:uncharacterized protein YjbI with pentapeptide repeats